MKKLFISFFAFAFSFGAFAQPVSDMGIVPIGVTLNSIMRLQIVKGGNIEFVVNTIDQYTLGIANTTLYDTRFTVSSSVDFDVLMYSESGTLTGTDDATHTMDVDNIGYLVENTGGGAIGTEWTIPSAAGTAGTNAVPLQVSGGANTEIITGIPNFAAGDINQNDFTVHWELGTQRAIVAGMTLMEIQSLLDQSIAADRYVVNVIINVQTH